ncbi:MAG: TRAP transporter permease, partial [Gammaproteobacteria bacterium]|nr:TRAP transporter permease [Gammaproteobacteria bacterium]
TFTIPLMKKTGLPAHKAAAVEVAASTNSQLMPPVMGAAAFIMAEILGMPYMDVVRAALIPALVSYLTLFYVVHLESLKLDLKPLPRASLPPFFKTVLRGLHYLVPLIVMLVYLVILRRSAITSVLLAIEALLIIMLIQRPVLAFLAHAPNSAQSSSLHKVLLRAFWTGMTDIFQGLVNGARNMIPVGIATATAGIIVGTVTITGLISRFVSVIETLAFGNIYLVLILTALTSMILGMGLPTTANYIVMATLTAPVIAQLSGAAGLVLPLLAVHLFVFYFGILADDTPPVGLAAYAAAAIGKADPIKTGVQGFVYDLRTALLPFVFLFNLELLTIAGVDANGNIIWLNDIFRVIYVFVFSTLGMFIVAAALQGYFMRFCQPAERILLLIAGLLILQPKLLSMLNLPLEFIRITCVCVCIGLYVWQRRHPKHDKM